MKNIQIKVAAFFVLAGLSVNPASAEEVDFGATIPSSQELINILKPQDGSFEATTRGIVIKVKDQAKTGSPERRPVAGVVERQAAGASGGDAKSASLQIQFEFDSDQLSDYAELQLQPLGLALQSQQLSGITFVLEGHTDATGSELYNQSLSERRAVSIKQHLISRYEIPEANLSTRGLGESQLLLPASPADAANRRVRIVNQL